MEPVKPGIKTTEFYATLAALLVALAITFGLVDPADEQPLTAALADVLTAVASLLAAAHVVARYIHGRTALKLHALEARR